MSDKTTEKPSSANFDQFLRAFFRKEMPNPWPAAKIPAPGHGLAWYLRAVIAACFALALIGYLVLAAMFPTEREPGLNLDRSHTIGMKPHISTGAPSRGMSNANPTDVKR